MSKFLNKKKKNVFEKTVDAIYEEMGRTFTHHGEGTSIRNGLKLWWQPSWNEPKPEIVKWFNDLNIFHADDMSGSINAALEAKKMGKPFDIHEHIKTYFEHWTKGGFEDGIFPMVN